MREILLSLLVVVGIVTAGLALGQCAQAYDEADHSGLSEEPQS